MNDDDERAAREWFRDWADSAICYHPQHAATILRLLDRPVLPRGEDVPNDVIDQMTTHFWQSNDFLFGMRGCLNLLREHLTAPLVKKVEMWAVYGTDLHRPLIAVLESRDLAVTCARQHPSRRIVRLVEAADDQ